MALAPGLLLSSPISAPPTPYMATITARSGQTHSRGCIRVGGVYARKIPGTVLPSLPMVRGKGTVEKKLGRVL